ncbi:hypothetical protein PCASD_24417 [Puccinia coronata f. sp. avenae]|uniref:Golgi to ER traffic-protein n=1 Tax=Puccinia coronata f. sp. avenae TaxID=200324 RepID=A0A2N5TI86_9BASI|nr:hypothetical protein PCASD_24417 [Puccinia coronata f. sp. avenae]
MAPTTRQSQNPPASKHTQANQRSSKDPQSNRSSPRKNPVATLREKTSDMAHLKASVTHKHGHANDALEDRDDKSDADHAEALGTRDADNSDVHMDGPDDRDPADDPTGSHDKGADGTCDTGKMTGTSHQPQPNIDMNELGGAGQPNTCYGRQDQVGVPPAASDGIRGAGTCIRGAGASTQPETDMNHPSQGNQPDNGLGGQPSPARQTEMPAPPPDVSIEELKELHALYTMHKLGLEETLKSHLTACAPSLKSLMKTTHKALTEFLVKNGEKLDQAHRDKSTSSKVTVIDLTLANEDIEIIAPRLRAPTKPPPNNTAVQQTSQAKKKRKRSQPVNKTDKTPSAALFNPIKIRKKKKDTPAPNQNGHSGAENGTQSARQATEAAPTVGPTHTSGSAIPRQSTLTNPAGPGPNPVRVVQDDSPVLPSPLTEHELKIRAMKMDVENPIYYGNLMRETDENKLIMENGDMRQVVQDLGKTATELTPLIYPAIQEIISGRVQHYQRTTGFEVLGFRLASVSDDLTNIMNFANMRQFSWIIRATPRLMQIGYGDLFFNKTVINFDNIAKALKIKDDKQVDSKHGMDASWGALAHQMIRSDNSDAPIYHKSDGIIKAAASRLSSLLSHSLGLLHNHLRPETHAISQDDNNPIQHAAAIEEASRFIAQKIATLATNTSVQNKTSGNGLHFLQKRMWETLQAMLIMHHSQVRQTALAKQRAVPLAASQINQDDPTPARKKDAELRDMWKSGPTGGMDSREWGKYRLCAIGSAAVFFAYGPGGWWTCFTDQNKYNQKSIWGTINLALLRFRHLDTCARPPSCNDADSNFSNHPWQNVERLMYSCLADLHLDRQQASRGPQPPLDWAGVLQSWHLKLNEHAISQAAMLDIIPEIARPQLSLTNAGNAALNVFLGNNRLPEGFYTYWERSLVDSFRLTQRTITGPPAPPPTHEGNRRPTHQRDPRQRYLRSPHLDGTTTEEVAHDFQGAMLSQGLVPLPPSGTQARFTAPNASSEDESDSDSDSDQALGSPGQLVSDNDDEEDPTAAELFGKKEKGRAPGRDDDESDNGSDDSDGGEEEQEFRRRRNPYYADSVSVRR